MSAPPENLAPEPSQRRRWLAAAVCLLLLLMASNWRVLIGTAVPRWDAIQAYSPLETLVAECARQGRLLLWNPWSNGGVPDFIEPQTAALSPLAVGIGLLIGPKFMAYNVYWLVWWLAGALGVLALSKHFKAPVWISLAIASGYLFNCIYMGNAQHASLVSAFSALPWMIWRLDVALLERRFWPAVQCGAVWGFTGLAGYPGVIIPAGAFLAAWALGRWLTNGIPARLPAPDAGRASRLPAWLLAIAALSLVLLVGGSILAPTYASFAYESRGFTDRSGALPYEAVIANSLAPGTLSTFASPYLPMLWMYNKPVLWPSAELSGCTMYTGCLMLPLALLALVIAPRDRWRWWLAFLAVVSVGLALGDSLPLRGWLYDVFYPSRYFRHSTNFRYFAVVVVAVLALEGGRDLVADPRRHARRFALIITAVTLVAFASFAWVAHTVEDRGPQMPAAVVHLALGWGVACTLAWLYTREKMQQQTRAFAALLILFAIADGWVTREVSNPMVEQDIRNPAVQLAVSNYNASLDLTPLNMARVSESPFKPSPSNLHLLLKMPVLVGYSAMHNVYMDEYAADGVLSALVSSDGEQSRVWFSPQAVESGISAAEFRAFVERAHVLSAMPAVVQSRGSLLSPKTPEPVGEFRAAAIASAPAASRIHVDLVAYRPEELHFRVHCPEAGWLLVTDRWSRSWSATVNGQPVGVEGGGFLFRAVRVVAGDNDVRFTFTPMGIPAMLIVSWTTLAAVTAASIYLVTRKA